MRVFSKRLISVANDPILPRDEITLPSQVAAPTKTKTTLHKRVFTERPEPSGDGGGGLGSR